MQVQPDRFSGSQQPRLLTRVPGLDEILVGGLVRGGSYLISGYPGTGKTTLGNQIAFGHAKAGEQAVFATVLAEPHDRMLANLAGFSFFDRSQVGQLVQYVNIYEPLSHGDLKEGLRVLRQLIRDYQATLLVVDGTSVLEQLGISQLDLSRFIYELHAQTAVLGCTVLLLSLAGPGAIQHMDTYVDGLIYLEDKQVGLRDVRYMHVPKIRGVDHVRGLHHYIISSDGIAVFPRLESLSATGVPPRQASSNKMFGVVGLDNMLDGGMRSGSSTLVLGPSGAGKTFLGLHFIADGLRQGENGLIVTFRESQDSLLGKGASVGQALEEGVSKNRLHILRYRFVELLPDAWAHEVVAAVERYKIRRVFLDSLLEIEQLLETAPGRTMAFLTTLLDRLADAGATTLISAESRILAGTEVSLPPFATLTDNAIMLRTVELQSQLHRLISVIKVRDGSHDTALREFHIGPNGFEVANTFVSAEAVLTGIARLNPTVSGRGVTSQHPDDPT